MVDESYADSDCPYHRALYWVSSRWIKAVVLLTVPLLLLAGYYI